MKPYYEHNGITIYHGDCREILPQLPISPLMVVDPPYGVGRKYGANYDDARGGYWEWFKPTAQMLKASAKVVAMHHRLVALKELTDWDWAISWVKPYGAGVRLGHSPLLPHWEPILLWGIHKLGPRGESVPDVIRMNPEPSPRPKQHVSHRNMYSDEGAGHPLPKPVNLEMKLIVSLSNDGDAVIDPFMGSGTTLVAAKNLGRKAIGIEIEERYCEIAAERLRQEVLVV